MNIHKLLESIKTYINDEMQIEMIFRAYFYAEKLHRGQRRQSGEEYIIHPLSVAFILSEVHADADTITAALLHDVIEDTDATKEDIAEQFNKDVANLVEGVTKISKMEFSAKSDEIATNTRKIITGMIDDVRIVIIKLADRLHNMRTLQFKDEFKQKENALETMEMYVPLAYYIGAYKIKGELEDLSLRYLKPGIYADIAQELQKIKSDTEECLREMLITISNVLNDENIPHHIRIRTKNIYGVYKRLIQNYKIRDIHDLLALKVIVDNVKNCYYTLGLVHSKYPPINNKFKDYIAIPKTNMYASLHTTVFGPGEILVQTQIRTFDMDKIASFGLTAYWDIYGSETKMQRDFKKHSQFFQSLIEINSIIADNQEFLSQIKRELFANKVYIYTAKGDIIELPSGSTPIDCAYKIDDDIGNTMVAAIVNGEYVPVDYILQNKDRVRIITGDLACSPNVEWIDKAQTTYAKQKLKELLMGLSEKKN